MIQDTPNFRVQEFLCKCCGGGADIIQQELLNKLQEVRDAFGSEMVLNCGYRCVRHNQDVGGAPDSAHLTGEAADISDPLGRLLGFLAPPTADQTARLEQFGLWMESPTVAKTWRHLQIRPASKRIFIP